MRFYLFLVMSLGYFRVLKAAWQGSVCSWTRIWRWVCPGGTHCSRTLSLPSVGCHQSEKQDSCSASIASSWVCAPRSQLPYQTELSPSTTVDLIDDGRSNRWPPLRWWLFAFWFSQHYDNPLKKIHILIFADAMPCVCEIIKYSDPFLMDLF
jgi:hypothetical protein